MLLALSLWLVFDTRAGVPIQVPLSDLFWPTVVSPGKPSSDASMAMIRCAPAVAQLFMAFPKEVGWDEFAKVVCDIFWMVHARPSTRVASWMP